MGSPGSSRHSLVHSLQGSRRGAFADYRPPPTFRECYVQVTPFGDRLARCPPGDLSTPRESETQSGSTVKRRTSLGPGEVGLTPPVASTGAGLVAGPDRRAESLGGPLGRGPVAGASDAAEYRAGVGRRDGRRM